MNIAPPGLTKQDNAQIKRLVDSLYRNAGLGAALHVPTSKQQLEHIAFGQIFTEQN